MKRLFVAAALIGTTGCYDLERMDQDIQYLITTIRNRPVSEEHCKSLENADRDCALNADQFCICAYKVDEQDILNARRQVEAAKARREEAAKAAAAAETAPPEAKPK